jgi:Ca2+-binding RTX toxin-like protein
VETDAPFYGGEPSSSESYSNWETGQPYTYDSYDYASVYLHDSATDAGSYYGKWYSVSQSTRKYVLIEYGGSAGDEQGPVVLSGDRLLGGDGDDRLVAKGSADMVDGGAGADRLDLDLRRSADPLSITFADPAVPQTLPGGGSIVNVESFRIQAGIGNDVIVGGALADELFAGFGNDILDGGLGPDVLTGGPGADLFRFSSLAASTGEADSIQDFSVTEGDRIQLPASVFPGLGEEGVLAPERFHVGSAPTAATHRILYNPGDGILFYVADPLSAQVVPFGRAISGLPLTADQFPIS